MLGAEPAAAARHAHDHWQIDRAAVRVPIGRGVEEDFGPRAEHEVGVLQLGDRAHPAQRHADGHADDEVLADRRVEDAIAELLRHATSDAPHAAERADVLTEDDDRVVAPQFDAQRFPNRVRVLDGTAHRPAPGCE